MDNLEGFQYTGEALEGSQYRGEITTVFDFESPHAPMRHGVLLVTVIIVVLLSGVGGDEGVGRGKQAGPTYRGLVLGCVDI